MICSLNPMANFHDRARGGLGFGVLPGLAKFVDLLFQFFNPLGVFTIVQPLPGWGFGCRLLG